MFIYNMYGMCCWSNYVISKFAFLPIHETEYTCFYVYVASFSRMDAYVAIVQMQSLNVCVLFSYSPLAFVKISQKEGIKQHE